jgi:hypothetical protein
MTANGSRPHASIVRWGGETQRLSDDLLLVRAGGHFAGATVLHCAPVPMGGGRC